MTDNIKEILVGCCVLALVFGLFSVSARPVNDAGPGFYRIIASFNRVDGLEVSSPVRLGGVNIGTVTDMQLNQNFRAAVTLTLSETVQLPLDSSAAIHTDGLFGSKFIEIEPGGSEEMLEQGDEIDFTQDAVVVSELLDLIIAQGKAAQAKRRAAAEERSEEN